MKYLCLIYNEEAKLATVPQAEIDAVVEECRKQDAVLSEKDQLLASERLQPVSTATTLRMENGKTSVVDGPFAETREQLGGFYLYRSRGFGRGNQRRRAPPAGSLRLRRDPPCLVLTSPAEEQRPAPDSASRYAPRKEEG